MTQADQSVTVAAATATIEELLDADGNGLSYMDEASAGGCFGGSSSKPDIVVTNAPDTADEASLEDEDQLVSVSRQPSVIDCNGAAELEPEDPRTPPDGQEDSSSDSESLVESIYHQPPKAADREAARRLAKRLFMLEGFRHTDVAKHLSRKNDFNTLVGEEYAALFDFSDDTLDTALRKFLSRFCLQGETADQERVLLHFAKSYLRCNPDSYPTADSCHTLACALLLLNKDLHGAIGQRMTSQQFIDNLANLNEGQNYPREVLKSLYQAIKSQPILQPAGVGPLDSTDAAVAASAAAAAGAGAPTMIQSASPGGGVAGDAQSGAGSAAAAAAPGTAGPAGLSNPAMAMAAGDCGGGPGIEFRRGFLVRKNILDPGGRRTRKGRRAWRRVFCVLKDLSLGLHKDESAASAANPLPDGDLRVHHALAGLAPEYTKRRYVWRLRLANGAELLLQGASQADADVWVEAVNRAAARLSSQALPAPVGSQLNSTFARPLLPSGPSNLPLAEQLARHLEHAASVKTELQALRVQSDSSNATAAAPASTAASSPINAASQQVGSAEFQRHVAFLQRELVRYRAYIQLLEAEIASNNQLTSSNADSGGDNAPSSNDPTLVAPAPIGSATSAANNDSAEPNAAGVAVAAGTLVAGSAPIELYEIV